jgi:hypothetical protein
MDENIKEVLAKMCGFIGVDFKEVNFGERDWSDQYAWTSTERNGFKVWMTNLLTTKPTYRRSFMPVPSGGKKAIEVAVNNFIANCGWILDDEKSE